MNFRQSLIYFLQKLMKRHYKNWKNCRSRIMFLLWTPNKVHLKCKKLMENSVKQQHLQQEAEKLKAIMDNEADAEDDDHQKEKRRTVKKLL